MREETIRTITTVSFLSSGPLHLHLRASSLHLFLTAIQRLDVNIRKHYETAVEVFPELVRKETPIMSFLRVENFDVDRAAHRLALYWKYRRQIFGDRWLLRMSQTGSGTLDMAAIEMLRTGYHAVFNRAPQDGFLLIMDYNRLTHFDPALHLQIVMYIATTFTDEPSQTHGVTVLYTVHSQGGVLEMNPEDWAMVATAMPLKAKQLLVARAFVEGKEGILNYLTYQTARVHQYKSGRVPEQLIADSFTGTLRLLEDKGCHRQHLPRFLGGDWEYSQFDEWIRRRISIEDVLAVAPMHGNRLSPPAAPPSRDASSGHSLLPLGMPAYSHRSSSHHLLLPGSAKGESSMAAVYSRRYYHKRKLRDLGLQQEVSALRNANARLRQEQERLCNLLRMALLVVSVNPDQSSSDK